MLIPFPNIDSWEKLNRECSDLLSVTPGFLQCFFGPSHALRECARGLAELYPHKMSLSYLPQAAFYIDDVAKAFSRFGFKIQPLSKEDLKAVDPEKLSKETLFVILSEDHPITGEVFDTKIFKETCVSKKIFVISLYHNIHRFRKIDSPPATHEIRIFCTSGDRAYALLGERCRFTPFIAGQMAWENVTAKSFMVTSAQENKEKVVAFENQSGATPFFNEGASRLFDRAVVYWPDMDGSALIDELGESGIETTSLCRWSNNKYTQWMVTKDFNDNCLRGTVIFPVEKLDAGFAEKVRKARARVLELQG